MSPEQFEYPAGSGVWRDVQHGPARRAEHLRRDGEATFAAGRRLGEAELRRSLAEKVRGRFPTYDRPNHPERDEAIRGILALIEGSDLPSAFELTDE